MHTDVEAVEVACNQLPAREREKKGRKRQEKGGKKRAFGLDTGAFDSQSTELLHK
jgi:hypothetical protein